MTEDTKQNATLERVIKKQIIELDEGLTAGQLSATDLRNYKLKLKQIGSRLGINGLDSRGDTTTLLAARFHELAGLIEYGQSNSEMTMLELQDAQKYLPSGKEFVSSVAHNLALNGPDALEDYTPLRTKDDKSYDAQQKIIAIAITITVGLLVLYFSGGWNGLLNSGP